MSTKSDSNLDKYNLIHAPIKTAYRTHTGQMVAIVPEPSDFDCPDCVFAGECATLPQGVKAPCEMRPDGIQCVYWRVSVLNPAPIDLPGNLLPDSDSE